MRLFVALCRRTHMPPGHIWKGKRRLYKEVTPEHLRSLKERLDIEEQNMFYLRHAFLTPEQSYGHAQALGKNEANYYKTVTKRREFYQDVTAESRLAHLRHGEVWD